MATSPIAALAGRKLGVALNERYCKDHSVGDKREVPNPAPLKELLAAKVLEVKTQEIPEITVMSSIFTKQQFPPPGNDKIPPPKP